ncbi:MAG: aminomethyl-transferring glycine dehydrogenase [Bacteroidales bacterium]|nr:aminomethyl-transferring glycine dehydrogenase [Bacteroidales bacterium]
MALDKFINRHNGIKDSDHDIMLKKIGVGSMKELIDQTIPQSIQLDKPLEMDPPMSEYEYFNHIREIASKNKLYRSFIGKGYYDTILPSVIQRNILENPGWYTSYTPYQAEISQGRLEALLNFQTVVMEMTGMELANASLLDEATAAAEAMIMMANLRKRSAVKKGANTFFIDENTFPQTIELLKTRSEPLNIELQVGKYQELEFNEKIFGALVQYPAADGKIEDYREFVEKAHDNGSLVAVAADIMSLALLTPPGEWGVDVVVGSTQRFGIPMGYGGPHAAYFATRDEYKRKLPGRIIGVSKDAQDHYALRMALQVREQHIKRERATSNICTAQALLASMAAMYAVYHGPEGLKRIARHIHSAAALVSDKLEELGYKQENKDYFDTLRIQLPDHVKTDEVRKIALEQEVNFYYAGERTIDISLDEKTLVSDVNRILKIFAGAAGKDAPEVDEISDQQKFNKKFNRQGEFLTMDLFHRYRSETSMMRYIKKLERKDYSLAHSMISLGSCTMKLNAATELLSLSWPEFMGLHPYVPEDQAQGYLELIDGLEQQLKAITGFSAFSFQPNSGAAGEHTGLMVIRQYHIDHGDRHRNVVLVPSSAHGTNPASGIMAGMKVVVVECDENGNIDIHDLKKKAEENKDNLAAFMVTYPSTHGVFESKIQEMNQIIHDNGGLVYLDGANLNAQLGLTNPVVTGADVGHLNLHKTFAIPHGGGGPGMGPIGVVEKLVPYLPQHPFFETGGEKGITAVAAAPFGSPSILPISYGFIKMLGAEGLRKVGETSILNANYIAASLKDTYGIVYSGETGMVGHEMILECRQFKSMANITEADIAKRLMDYGFHAPTLSFPVHGTLMVEPTESESLHELERFIQAMLAIYDEIMEIKEGKADPENNALKNSPHTAQVTTSDEWNRPYGRQKAAFPLEWIADNKFWPAVSRIDDGYGDRNLMCSCAPIEEYRESTFTFKEVEVDQ